MKLARPLADQAIGDPGPRGYALLTASSNGVKRRPAEESALPEIVPSASDPLQLSLLLLEPTFDKKTRPKSSNELARSARDRSNLRNVELSTNQVLRVLGVNRSTLFRWTKSGKFPPRHASGGWLRAEIDKWLKEKQ